MRRRFSFVALGAGLGAALVGACFNLPALPAGADAGASSGGSSSSSSGGSTTKPDAGGPFCPSFKASDYAVFFCSDFDPPEAALPGPWTTQALTNGTLAENTATYRSPPNSLDENVNALAATDTVDVALRQPLAFPSLPATMTLSMDINPVAIDPEAGAAIILTALDFFDESQRQYSLQLAGDVVSGALTLELGEVSVLGQADGGPPFVPHPLPTSLTLQTDSWSTLDIVIQWQSKTEAQAVVHVNGTEELNLPLTVTVAPASMQVDIGTSFVAPKRPAGQLTGPWEIRYDNVLFTAK